MEGRELSQGKKRAEQKAGSMDRPHRAKGKRETGTAQKQGGQLAPARNQTPLVAGMMIRQVCCLVLQMLISQGGALLGKQTLQENQHAVTRGL